MKQIIFILLMTFNFSLYAKNQQILSYTKLGVSHIYVPHKDGDEWIIDEFQITKNSLQEKTNSWKYLDFNAFQEKINDIQKLQEYSDTTLPLETESLATTEDDTKRIWTAKYSWDQSWEKRFADWMETEVDARFLSRYNISTDCADAMIALRWIFSRIHGLSMGSSLAGSGVIFSNDSFRRAWDGLSTHDLWYNDEVFLAAIDYLMDNAYTNTLWEDSFPVAIKKEHLHAGTFFLYKTRGQISGHTQIILRARSQIIIAESTVPRRVRDLSIRVFYPPTPIHDYSGVRSFKWLKMGANGKNYLVEAKDHPHFSEEQYDENFIGEFGEFYNAVFYRLELKYNYRIHLRNLKKMVKSQLKSRVDVVNEGYEICSRQDCSPGSENYENWSTPSRDKRIKETFMAMDKIVEKNGKKFYKKRYEWYLKFKKLKIANGQKIRFKDLKETFLNDQFSSEPTSSVQERWNFKAE
jgi:hypothetical protein